MAEGLVVRPIQARDLEATASLLADAFEVDAAYRAMFPGPGRREGLRDLFSRNLRTHLPYGCTWVAEADGGLAATLTVRPPGGIDLGLLTMLRQGALPFLWANGLGAMRRLLWIKSHYERIEEQAAEGRPHWFLHMMAVDPARQGQGIGSQVLDQVLERTVATEPSIPTVLTTHIERNLAFYRRVGFELVDTRSVHVPGAPPPYPVWVMVRRA